MEEIRFSNKGFFGLANNFGSDIAILVLKEALKFGPAVLPACIDWTGVRNGEYLKENALGKVNIEYYFFFHSEMVILRGDAL